MSASPSLTEPIFSLPATPQKLARSLASESSEASRSIGLQTAMALADPSVFSPETGRSAGVSRAVGAPCSSWLHAFARQGDYDSSLMAAKKASDINRPDSDDGASPLLLAFSNRNLDAALAFIDAGANVKARDRDGLGVLHHAAFSGEAALLNLALAIAPEQLNERSVGSDLMLARLGQGPVEYDDRSSPSGALSASIRSASVRAEWFENEGLAPIHCAAIASDADGVNFLIEAKADINALSGLGDSCLGLAVKSGCVASVDAFIKAGADVNALDRFGRSPLAQAVALGAVESVKALLNAGASLEAQGPSFDNPSKLAPSAQMEMDNGCDPRIKVAVEALFISEAARGSAAPAELKGARLGL